jgi:ubiquitin-protein ligase
MSADPRQARLVVELERVRALKQLSGIVDFEALGDPPERYTLTFRGRGIAGISPEKNAEYGDLHRVDLRLPYTFPRRAPDLRWLTPIFHPNISFSGYITLESVGLQWEDDLGLDAICERLWDVARFAYVDEGKSTNLAANSWLGAQTLLHLPIDRRSLRDRAVSTGNNVIRYQRLGNDRVLLPSVPPTEVLYIDENTPIPQLPLPTAPPRRLPTNDDEIFYIGPE